MKSSLHLDPDLALAAVGQGAPCVSSFLGFAAIDLRKDTQDPELIQSIVAKQHECLARAALEIFKENPTEWWRLCRADIGQQLDQVTGADVTALLVNKTLHDFVTKFRQWMTEHLSKEQQDAFYSWQTQAFVQR